MTDVHEALTAQAEFLDALLTPTPPPRRRWPFAVVAVAVLTAAVCAAVVVRSTSGPSGPPHPSKWDPRVQKYVDFVVQNRHLEFAHPVYVDFLSDAAFEKKVTSDPAELSDDDQKELDRETGMLRALGLVQGDVDLFDTSNELQGNGIIGYYSYDDERLRIRGTEITPAVESTIVHELTHALQDQNFDLGKRFADLAKADDADSSATADGFHALVEGDARRVETLWRDQLSDVQRAALDKEESGANRQFEKKVEDVPEAMVALMTAPYELGEALLAVAMQQGGDRTVDDLFRSPPRTEEQQLDPWTLVADHQGLLTVPAPEAPDGVKAFKANGGFGAVTWLLVLSERIPSTEALTAVDGWGGDSFAEYEQDGVSCVTVDYRADTPDDLAQMQSALRRWIANGPRGAASVTPADQTLVFTSCDPGTDAKTTSGSPRDALSLAVSRTYLSLELVKQGAAVKVARCSADRLVHEFTVKELNDPHLDRDRVLRTILPCREQS